MMSSAPDYKQVNVMYLRALLTHGICTSFIEATEFKNKSLVLPTPEAFMGERALELRETIQKKKTQQKGAKSMQVQAFITAQQSFFTKADIQQACPNVSSATISKVVNELRKAGVIEMFGVGRNVQWRKVVE